eukprot:TRINITY_DN5569_c0_g1_i1.p1 TRINITY_DN5569_c0_g1~~TRINITY_DN5569_c0_g1_i1.p1  ORF type:complete len:226 (-),score=63.32 TRINITY_DN5569_c0_g1_i1:139-816(-)
MARTWADGKGGQCTKKKDSGTDFCSIHGRDNKWEVHGRVDGPIPEKKLREFLKASGVKVKPLPRKQKKAGEEVGDEKPRKKKEKPDPAAPKRPGGGAYGQFFISTRSSFLEPGMSIADVGKKAGEAWRALSAAEKTPFEIMYAEKVAAFKVAKAEYDAKVAREKGKKQHTKDDNADKQAAKRDRPAGGGAMKRPAAAAPAGAMKRPAAAPAKGTLAAAFKRPARA